MNDLQFPPQQFTFKDGTPARDIQAHLSSRAELVRLLVYHDPLVTTLFHTFENLWTITALQAASEDVFARECGWRDRAHMYAEPDLHDETQSPHFETFVALGFAFPWDRISGFRGVADQLVHETWSLPRHHPREQWSWLSADLTRMFVLAIVGTRMGRDYMLVFSSQEPTPSIDVTFSTRPNESAADARRRLKAWYEESAAALTAVPEERGGAFVDEDRQRRDVDWFYRNVLKRPPASQRWLALAYRDAQRAKGVTLSEDQRPTVQEGIKRARRLLSEIPA